MALTFGSLIGDIADAPSSAANAIQAEGDRFGDNVDAFGDDIQSGLDKVGSTIQGGIDGAQELAEKVVDNAKAILAKVPIIGGLFGDELSLTDKILIAVVVLAAFGLVATVVTGKRKGGK